MKQEVLKPQLVETITIEDDDTFWEALSIRSTKSKTSDQEEKQHLRQQISRLETENKQLQQQISASGALQSQLQHMMMETKTCQSKLAAAERNHSIEVSRLRSLLAEAQQQLAAARGDSANNSATVQTLRRQASDYKTEADRAQSQLNELQEQLNNQQSKLTQSETEKKLLLDSINKLLDTNKGLQAKLEELQQARSGSGCAQQQQQPKTNTPPQSTPPPPKTASTPPQQPPPSQAQQQQQQQPRQAFSPTGNVSSPAKPYGSAAQYFAAGQRSTKCGAGAADAARPKKRQKRAATADTAAADKWSYFWQQQGDRHAATAAEQDRQRAEEMEQQQQRLQEQLEAMRLAEAERKLREQQQKQAEAAAKAAAAAQEAQRKAEEARKQAEAEAERKRAADEHAARMAEQQKRFQQDQQQQRQQQQQQTDAGNGSTIVNLSAQVPSLDGMSVKDLRQFLKQAQVADKDMVGVVEKSDLLRLAKSRTQLWECRRINTCGTLMSDIRFQLNAAMAVFRIACSAGQDAVTAVKAAKNSLKQTYKTLALTVHPDKVEHSNSTEYRAVFSDAFKVLGNAHELLTKVASGEQIPGVTTQQQQQQQGPGTAGFGANGSTAGGFGPGASWSYPGGTYPGGPFGSAGFGFAGGFPGGPQYTYYQSYKT